MRFDIIADGRIVGTSRLEHFDDGMGVAFGAFHPTSSYTTIRGAVIRAAEARRAGQPGMGPTLHVVTESGERLTYNFVTIDDFEVPVDPEISVQLADRTQWERFIGRRA